MQVYKLNDTQLSELAAIDAQMLPIQNELDGLDKQVQQATKIVDAIKDQIRAIRPRLVPLAEKKALIAKQGTKVNK